MSRRHHHGAGARRGLVTLLVALSGACDDARRAPIAPSLPVVETPAPQEPARPTAFTIVNGVTGDSVPGAQIHHVASTHTTDGAGHVEMPVACAEALIVAPGFLDRKLRCLARTVMPAELPLTLWPVADEFERAATRAALFPGDRLSGYPVPLYLSAALSIRPEVVATWEAASAYVRTESLGAWDLPVRLAPMDPSSSGDDGFIVDLPPSAPCQDPWFTWSWTIAGFCWERGPGYFNQTISVAADAAARPDIARRAVLHAAGYRQHGADGIMNATRPAAELSPFERRTLAMVAQRPRPIAWPDDELCRFCF